MTRILVVNDDGINAPGIKRLVSELSSYAEVYVAAPAIQHSAKSQSITINKEVSVSETAMYGAFSAWEVDGSPTDCVMWAVDYFKEKGVHFDYIFSGINHGENYGIAAYYSGTIGAAREGALNGIRAIAMSVDGFKDPDFDYICTMIPKVLEMSASLGPSTILSVNAPDLPAWAVKGVRIAEVAPWGYKERFGFSETESGNYIMGSHKVRHAIPASPERAKDFAYGYGREYSDPAEGLRYDIDCIHNGYAAVTPLTTKVSDTAALNRLMGLFPNEQLLPVFIDVQENVVSGVLSRERFERNIGSFARCMNRLGLPSLVTELYGYGDTLPCVGVEEGRSEKVIRREFSAWGSNDFVSKMNNLQTESIILAGAETHISVLRTALDFLAEGYKVTVIEDCCASRGGHDHKMAIEAMRDAGCRVMTYRMAVMQILYSTNHPAAESVIRMLNENS